jgi:hypothetical protein
MNFKIGDKVVYSDRTKAHAPMTIIGLYSDTPHGPINYITDKDVFGNCIHYPLFEYVEDSQAIYGAEYETMKDFGVYTEEELCAADEPLFPPDNEHDGKFKLGDSVECADTKDTATIIGHNSNHSAYLINRDVLDMRDGETLEEFCKKSSQDIVYSTKYSTSKNFGYIDACKLHLLSREHGSSDMSSSNDSKYSVETVKEIWNNKTGEHIEVGADRDGLDLVEVRLYDDCNYSKASNRMSFTQEQAIMVAEAILELYKK